MFPRRIRRGLIEAYSTPAVPSAWSHGFRGEFAAASLKPCGVATGAEPGAGCFRGEFAAASLKLTRLFHFVNCVNSFRGEFAAASLKRRTREWTSR